MGASDWSYTVDDEEDVSAALEHLRQRVFAAGDYFPMTMNPEYARLIGRTPMQRPPSGIQQLLHQQREEGTHSILDIHRGVSATPAPGTASPLSAPQLLAAFGTTTPDCAQVEAWMQRSGHASVRGRGQAVYIVCTQDGHPRHIHFGGRSGD